MKNHGLNSRDVVEEKGKDILVEEGNMHATKVPKARCNLESESKTKKPRQATGYETNESQSSREHIEKKVKPQGVNSTKQTKISKKRTQKKSILPATADVKGKVQMKIEKPKVSLELSNKTRKSKGIIEIDDSGELEKKSFVHDADRNLEKIELVEEARKCVLQKGRKNRSHVFQKESIMLELMTSKDRYKTQIRRTKKQDWSLHQKKQRRVLENCVL